MESVSFELKEEGKKTEAKLRSAAEAIEQGLLQRSGLDGPDPVLPGFDACGMNILVVGNEKRTSEFATKALKQLGYRNVVAYETAFQALERAEECLKSCRSLPGEDDEMARLSMFREADSERVDLVLVSMLCPDMKGLDFAQKIKELQQRFHKSVMRPIPVLMMSSSGDVGSVERVLDKGAVEMLDAPFTEELLQNRVDLWLYAVFVGRVAESLVDRASECHQTASACVVQLAEAKAKFDFLRERLSDLTTGQKEANAKIATLVKENEGMKRHAGGSAVVRREHGEDSKRVRSLQAELEALKSEMGALQTQVVAGQEVNAELEDLQVERGKQVRELEATVESLRAQLSKEQQEREQAVSVEAKGWKQRVTDLEAEMKEKCMSLEEAEKKLKQSERRVEDLSRKRIQLLRSMEKKGTESPREEVDSGFQFPVSKARFLNATGGKKMRSRSEVPPKASIPVPGDLSSSEDDGDLAEAASPLKGKGSEEAAVPDTTAVAVEPLERRVSSPEGGVSSPTVSPPRFQSHPSEGEFVEFDASLAPVDVIRRLPRVDEGTKAWLIRALRSENATEESAQTDVISLPGDSGGQQMHSYVARGELEELKKFLQACAALNMTVDVNARTQKLGRVPLHFVGFYGLEAKVEARLAAVAEQAGPQRQRRAAAVRRELAAKRARDNEGMIELLLVEWGGDVNALDAQHHSALFLAVCRRDVACVRALLAKRADPDSVDVDGCTPLYMLCAGEGQELVEEEGSGAPLPPVPGGAVGSPVQQEPLGVPEMVSALLQAGADPQLKNNRGITPFEAARRRDSKPLLSILRKHGASRRTDDRRENDMPPSHVQLQFSFLTPQFRRSPIWQWSFDTYALSDDERVSSALEMMQLMAILETFKIPVRTMTRALRGLPRVFRGEPGYTNSFERSLDTFHMVFLLLARAGGLAYLTKTDALGMFVAALLYRADRPAFDNEFQILTDTDLAAQYNEQNILENHSVDFGFEYLSEVDNNIFSHMTEKTFQSVKSAVIECIIWSNPDLFRTLTLDFENRVLSHQHTFSMQNIQDRRLLRRILFHAAAHFTPCRMLPVSRKLIAPQYEENIAQGDAMKEAGLEVPAKCQRVAAGVPHLALNMIDERCLPLAELLSSLLPTLMECAEGMKMDRLKWQTELSEQEVAWKQREEKKRLYMERLQSLAQSGAPAGSAAAPPPTPTTPTSPARAVMSKAGHLTWQRPMAVSFGDKRPPTGSEYLPALGRTALIEDSPMRKSLSLDVRQDDGDFDAEVAAVQQRAAREGPMLSLGPRRVHTSIDLRRARPSSRPASEVPGARPAAGVNVRTKPKPKDVSMKRPQAASKQNQRTVKALSSMMAAHSMPVLKHLPGRNLGLLAAEEGQKQRSRGMDAEIERTMKKLEQEETNEERRQAGALAASELRSRETFGVPLFSTPPGMHGTTIGQRSTTEALPKRMSPKRGVHQ